MRETEADQPAPVGSHHPRWQLWALLVPIGLMVVGGWVGGIAYATLVRRHPAVLMALNPVNKTLILVTNRVTWPTFYGLGTFRLFLPDPFFYVLGVRYGDRALRWLERKLGAGAAAYTWFEKAFAKAAWPMVFVAPNNIICLLAGGAALPIPAFVGLDLAGTVTRLYLIRLLGRRLQEPIDAVTRFLDRYRWPLLALGFALFAVSMLRRERSGEGTPVDALLDAEADLEGDAA